MDEMSLENSSFAKCCALRTRHCNGQQDITDKGIAGLCSCAKALPTIKRQQQYMLIHAGIHTAHQAFTSMAAGADYAAPYLGRMIDARKNVRADNPASEMAVPPGGLANARPDWARSCPPLRMSHSATPALHRGYPCIV